MVNRQARTIIDDAKPGGLGRSGGHTPCRPTGS
jgi:hypothetical protein